MRKHKPTNVEIVYGKIHESFFLPLPHVRFKFRLACLVLQGLAGVWKQQSRLGGRARNPSAQAVMSRVSMNWSIRLALVT